MFVEYAWMFLPIGFGFIAGATVYPFGGRPGGVRNQHGLPGGGKRELTAGVAAGVLGTVPLLWI